MPGSEGGRRKTPATRRDLAGGLPYHDHANGTIRTKVVSALDIAHALARELDLSTGILPPDTLWWTNTPSGPRIAIWREPQVWAVSLRETPGGAPRKLRLPFPGLVFVCLPAK